MTNLEIVIDNSRSASRYLLKLGDQYLAANHASSGSGIILTPDRSKAQEYVTHDRAVIVWRELQRIAKS